MNPNFSAALIVLDAERSSGSERHWPGIGHSRVSSRGWAGLGRHYRHVEDEMYTRYNHYSSVVTLLSQQAIEQSPRVLGLLLLLALTPFYHLFPCITCLSTPVRSPQLLLCQRGVNKIHQYQSSPLSLFISLSRLVARLPRHLFFLRLPLTILLISSLPSQLIVYSIVSLIYTSILSLVLD